MLKVQLGAHTATLRNGRWASTSETARKVLHWYTYEDESVPLYEPPNSEEAIAGRVTKKVGARVLELRPETTE